MIDHANELRRHARKIPHPQGETPGVMLRAADEIERLAATLEATEEDRARFLVEMGRLCAQCDALRLRIKAAEKERDALRAKIAEMEKQEPAGYGVRYVEPTNGEEDWDSIWKYRVFAEDHIKDFTQAYADVGEPVGASTVVPLYALPGAQPAPSFADAYQGAMEEAAIWKKRALEAEDLNRKFIAEINGPTHMGEPAQPTPSVPDGFSREDLEAVADGLDGYEKTVNVGNVTGEGDDHLESTTAYAARFIRAMLAAPEAKP